MDWEELALTSHYQTAMAISDTLKEGNVDDAAQGLEELIEALSRSDERALRSHLMRLMQHVIKLADLALRSLRRKLPELELALRGQFTAHHGRLIQGALELIDLMDKQIAQLDTTPGLNVTAAREVLAEIGTDMSRFGSAARLSAGAGVRPGNNESAGKRRRGKSRKGNRSLRRLLNQSAWAARKTSSYLGAPFDGLRCALAKNGRQ